MADTTINPGLLKRLIPINKLPVGDCTKLLASAHLTKLSPGQKIIASDSRRSMLYLINGELELTENGSTPIVVNSERILANQPLFTEGAEQVQAIASVHSTLLVVDKDQFLSLSKPQVSQHKSSKTSEPNGVEDDIYKQISQAFNSGQLQLPSLPDVALNVKAAASQPNVNVTDLADIIQADPPMVARLIQVANSPVSRGVSPVKNIGDAVVRLGLTTTQNLVISYAVKRLFKTESKILMSKMQQLYSESVEIAAVCFSLAHQARQFSSDELMLAGLIHNIGTIPILNHLEQSGIEIDDTGELDRVIENLCGPVGGMVIKTWNFAADFLAVAEESADFYRDSGKSLDMCDVVIAARILSKIEFNKINELPDVIRSPAFKKLFPAKQDSESVMDIIMQANEEITEVKQLLAM